MAELAASAFAAIGTAATAAAEAAPIALSASEMAAAGVSAGVEALPWAAGTTVTAAAPAMSSLYGGLQTAFSAASMASSIISGVAGYNSSQAQARFSSIDARQAELAAEAQSLEIHREMVKRIGAARVGFAASGLDVSSAADIESSLKLQASDADAMARASGASRSAVSRANASSAAGKGVGSLVTAIGSAAKTGFDDALSLARRG